MPTATLQQLKSELAQVRFEEQALEATFAAILGDEVIVRRVSPLRKFQSSRPWLVIGRGDTEVGLIQDGTSRARLRLQFLSSAQWQDSVITGGFRVSPSFEAKYELESAKRNFAFVGAVYGKAIDEEKHLMNPIVPLKLSLGELELPLQDALSLRPGQKIQFSLPEQLPVQLEVAGAEWVRGQVKVENGQCILTVTDLERSVKSRAIDELGTRAGFNNETSSKQLFQKCPE